MTRDAEFIAAARAKASMLSAEVARLRAVEMREVQDCARDKQHLADGYWQARHDAEERLRCARALCAALEEAA